MEENRALDGYKRGPIHPETASLFQTHPDAHPCPELCLRPLL